jgi:hypothetical protein
MSAERSLAELRLSDCRYPFMTCHSRGPVRARAEWARPANSCRSEAQTGASIAAGRNPTPNFVGLGQVRSVAPSLQISRAAVRSFLSADVQIRTPVGGSLDVEVRAAKPDCRSSGSMPDYGGWPRMGRWLVRFICRAKAYRQSRCCIRPGRRCLPRSSRHAIRAEGSVPCLR